MKRKCDKHEELLERANHVLVKIHELTGKQQTTVSENGVSERFLRMDRDLELAMGEKERAIGALREHDLEHGCQNGHHQMRLNGAPEEIRTRSARAKSDLM